MNHNFHDAGPELVLFWPGYDLQASMIKHSDFMQKYHAIDGMIISIGSQPVYFEPTNQYGYALWISEFAPLP
jgi:hypothetical protein